MQSFEFDLSDIIPLNVQSISTWLSLHIFVKFLEIETSTKFYDVFDHFLRTHDATKFSMIKLCLYVNNVIE